MPRDNYVYPPRLGVGTIVTGQANKHRIAMARPADREWQQASSMNRIAQQPESRQRIESRCTGFDERSE